MIKPIFQRVLSSKLNADQKFDLTRRLLSRTPASGLYDIEIGNRMRKWASRWNWQRSYADMLQHRGPYDFALTVRFQLSYKPVECRRLAGVFFSMLCTEAQSSGLQSAFGGSMEPDSLPIEKDMSLHMHCALRLRYPSDDRVDTVSATDLVLDAARSTVDNNGRIAVRSNEVKVRPIFFERGWALYLTKGAQRLKGDFTPYMFFDADGRTQFV